MAAAEELGRAKMYCRATSLGVRGEDVKLLLRLGTGVASPPPDLDAGAVSRRWGVDEGELRKMDATLKEKAYELYARDRRSGQRLRFVATDGEHVVMYHTGAVFATHTSDKACTVCAKPAGGDGGGRCGACKLVSYCSRSCQRAHWPMHKPLCKVVSQGSLYTVG